MDSSIKIAKLNNENYSTWKYKIELILLKDNLKEVIEREKNDNDNENDWKKKDDQAKALIGLSIEDSQLIHVRKLKNAKQYWDSLMKYHEQTSITSKVFILKKLCRMTMSEDENLEEHVATMLDLIEQYQVQDTENEYVLHDNLIVALILGSLPESYNNLITSLESRPSKELTLDLVKNKIIHEYRRRQELERENLNSNNDHTAMKMSKKSYKNTQMKCTYCKKNGHLRENCYFLKNNTKPETKPHFKANKMVEESNKSSDEDDSSEEYTDSYFCFMADLNKNKRTKWIIDSAATCHMTNNINFFSNIDTKYRAKIYLANGKAIFTSGIGNGEIKCDGSENKISHISITNVLYVPELDGNLLSVKKLTEKNYTVEFLKEDCFIKLNSNIIAIGSAKDHLYELNTINFANKITEENNCIHTWHRKLGHRDIKAIQQLINFDLADGIQIKNCNEQITCECCIQGKMTRKSLPKESHSRANAVLDLVHTDLCGPIPYITPTGNRYVLTFIDDYSRYTKVYFLKRKSEVFEKFKIYIAEVQNQFEKQIKMIRSDNGKEYINNNLDILFKENGIIHQTTIRYTPEQNGVAERKNRSLVEMAKCMLLDAEMDKKYWAEAINTANYLYNRLPTKACIKTPYELWTNKKPDLSYIQIFGTKAYGKIPDEKRKKFCDKSKLYRFVGYSENSKGFRLLDTDTNKIIVERSVQFIENSSYCKQENIIIKKTSDNPIEKPTFENIEIENNEEEEFYESASEDLEDNNTESSQEIILEDNTVSNVNGSNLESTESRRYSTRSRQPPKRYACKAIVEDPINLKEALQSDEKLHWDNAMKEEYESLLKNETWTLEQLPTGKKAIGCKWVYKRKTNENGETTRYKARLVAQGFTQKFGVDYDEVFAPVVKQTTIRTLLTVAGIKKLNLVQFDVKTAFLNGDIIEEIYMKQPEGFVNTYQRNLVCRLRKSLYGLKQSARAWNFKINSVLVNNGFKRSVADQCLYTINISNKIIYLLIYVDDILIACEDEEHIKYCENILKNEFEITSLGKVKNFLGLQIERKLNGAFMVHQTKYIEKIIKLFLTEDAKPSKFPLDPGYYKLCNKSKNLPNNEIYRKAIGSLLYISINTRPDISASVSILSRKISNPTELDWVEVKRVIRYLIGTKDYKLTFGNDLTENRLIGYIDADWAECNIDRKSNTGYLFKLFGGVINWTCRKQSSVSLSSTEAEYIALAEGCQEMKWIQYLLKDMNILNENEPPLIYEDNQSCLKMLKAEKLSSRTKHIDIKYHYIRELANNGEAEFKYCPTEKMIADILTKPLASIKMQKLSQELGLQINHVEKGC